MKIAALIARILLGLVFLVFGLNGFLHFLPMTMPTGVAGQFLGALFVSHYLPFIFFLQILGGVLLLINFFVPLALVLLGPILVNILFFHALMDPGGVLPAIIIALLWIFVVVEHRKYFSGLFVMKAED